MRLVLEISGGFYKGQKLWLREGQVLQIGRTEDADLALPKDTSLSGLHFVAECQYDACRVRDLNSRNGLFVNGVRVSEAVLADGDEITAGATKFNVRLEGLPQPVVTQPDNPVETGRDPPLRGATPDTAALPTLDQSTVVVRPTSASNRQDHGADQDRVGRTPTVDPRRTKANVDVTVVIPAPAAESPPSPPSKATVNFHTPGPATIQQSAEVFQELRRHKPGEGNRLYAVVDGASALKLVHHARRLELRTESLISGELSAALAAVAPYLVEVDPDCGYLDLWGEYAGRNAGVLIESNQDFDAVLAHARKLFHAVDDQGHESFFRFYDPRVIRAYLPACSMEELSQFFGIIAHLVVESEDSRQAIQFSSGPAGLIRRSSGPSHTASQGA